jgi:hypothetical protein
MSIFSRSGVSRAAGAVVGSRRQPRPADPPIMPAWTNPIPPTQRACCCPAAPVVRVIIPAGADRDHTVDLFLCGHHYRVCRESLTAASAGVYDAAGAPLLTGLAWELSTCHEPDESSARTPMSPL